MPVTTVCPECAAPVPASAPAGECPACLIRLSLAAACSCGAGPLPVDLRAYFDHLVIVQRVGRGGTATVYRVRDEAHGRTAALKVLTPDRADDPEHVERFMREAEAHARLAHPNVVAVFGWGRSRGLPYLLMEYVDGGTLRDLMRAGRLPPGECLRLAGQLCDALRLAHDLGLVHRDLKPENVLIDASGNVKLGDFGLAKLADDRTALTRAGDRMGTVRYMAPEQWADSAAVDRRADLYSLGLVLYELLTGGLPTPQYVPPSAKAGTGRRLDRVVARCLREKPADRYPTAAAVKADLDRVGKTPRWRPARFAAAGAVLAVAGVVALIVRPTDLPPQPPPTAADLWTSPDCEWSPPENLGAVNGPGDEGSPCVSADGLTLWLRSDRPGGQGGIDLYTSSRRTVAEPFGDPVNLGPPVNGPGDEIDPCVSADGRTLAYVSAQGGNPLGSDVFLSTRDGPDAGWGTPVSAGNGVNSRFAEFRPWLSDGGRTLTFVSTRPPADAVWGSRRADPAGEFGRAAPLCRGADWVYSGGPSFSPDGRVVLLNRSDARFPGDLLWLGRVEDPSDPFRHLRSFGPAVNSPWVDTNPVVSSAGSAVIFASDRPGGQGGSDLWLTRRVPKAR